MYTSSNIILLILILLSFTSLFSYRIVNIIDNSTYLHNKSINGYYLLVQLKSAYHLRKILDIDTIHSYEYHIDKITNVTINNNSNIIIGSDISLIKYKDYSTDEIMRVELLRIHGIQEKSLINKVTYIGEVINPSLVKINHYILIASGLAWGLNGGAPGTDRIEFRWVSKPPLPYEKFNTNNITSYLNINIKKFQSLNVDLYGQDPRLLWLDNNSLIVSFTWHRSDPVRMGVAQINCDDEGKLQILSIYYDIRPVRDRQYGHKNWTPFIYNHTLYFVVQINPFEVVRTKPIIQSIYNETYNNHSNSNYKMKIYHKTNMLAIEKSYVPYVDLKHWKRYGHIRGGTNALLVNNDRYLAFFHTGGNLPKNWLKSYFFGAYTFTKDIPFKLLEISPTPIILDKFYTGEWDFLTKRKINYCLFPMSYFIENDIIYLSFGYNDHSGYIAELNLYEVLNSLESINNLSVEDSLVSL